MSEYIFQLVIKAGPNQGDTILLTLPNMIIGRDPMADIVINDPEVSRKHAQLIKVEDGYQIRDMGSTNGSFVDGKRLSGEVVLLKNGQTVALGSSVALLFEDLSVARQDESALATMLAPPQAIEEIEAQGVEAVAEESEPVPVEEDVVTGEVDIIAAMAEPIEIEVEAEPVEVEEVVHALEAAAAPEAPAGEGEPDASEPAAALEEIPAPAVQPEEEEPVAVDEDVAAEVVELAFDEDEDELVATDPELEIPALPAVEDEPVAEVEAALPPQEVQLTDELPPLAEAEEEWLEPEYPPTMLEMPVPELEPEPAADIEAVEAVESPAEPIVEEVYGADFDSTTLEGLPPVQEFDRVVADVDPFEPLPSFDEPSGDVPPASPPVNAEPIAEEIDVQQTPPPPPKSQEQLPPVPPPPPPTNQAEGKGSNRNWWIIAGVVVVILLCCACIFLFGVLALLADPTLLDELQAAVLTWPTAVS